MFTRACGLRCLFHAVTSFLIAVVPSCALAAVSATVSGGVLTVDLSAADDVAVTCAGGQTRVNGAIPSPGPAATCASLIRVRVIATGSFANTIDLAGVERALGFSGLQISDGPSRYDVSQANLQGIAIAVNAGGGSDAYVGSDDSQLAESIVPGDGDDVVSPGFGSLGLILFNAPAPETDTVEITSADNVLGALPVTTPVTVDLNGGLGGDPTAILTHLNRVVKRAPTSTAKITTVYGGASDDVITGNAGSFTRFGFSGGDDTYLGGATPDVYVFEAGLGGGAVTIDDPGGDNELNFFNAGEPMTVDLTGGLGGGVLARSASNNIVILADAATAAAIRTIRGSESSDNVTGNAKDNVFLDCFGDDVYRGGLGNDTFNEFYGFLRVPGLTEFVSCGNDRYEGGPGDDTYQIACRSAAGLETKTLVELSGEGTDSIESTKAHCVAGTSLTLDLQSDGSLGRVAPSGGGPARQILQTGGAGQAAHFENAAGASNSATIFGNDAHNRLRSASPTALVFGGPGDDTFTGGTVSYANAPGPVVVDLREGSATGEGDDTLESSVLRVIGSPFDDVLRGRASAMIILSGGEGSDTMHGEFQNVLNGDGGNDLLTLSGGGTANGGAANDTLVALRFVSQLNGNEGDDTFLLNGGLHTVNGGAGADTIDARNEREDDQINCGTEIDLARTDPGDTVNADCESLNPGGTPGAPDPTGLALISCGGSDDLAFLAAASDASHVFFQTSQSLLPQDTDSAPDIYERTPGGLRLASAGTTNVAPTFDAINADGTRVFFDTNEALAEAGDMDAAFDVYERANGVLRLVSGGDANKDAFFGGITTDGSRVWFTSQDTLLPADADDEFDVYERQGPALSLLSGPGTGFTFFTRATANGSHVWFDSSKPLVPSDTDGFPDVYQRSGGALTLISDAPGGLFDFFGFTGASADGSHVYFSSFAGVGGEPGLYERGPGGTTNFGLGTLLAVASDGARVILSTREQLLPADVDHAFDLYRREGGVLTLLSGGTAEIDAEFRAASADATRVVFETIEPLLGADTDVALDLYQNDAGTVGLLSPGTADAHAVFRGAAADTTRVFFRTGEALLAADTDEGLDIYENDAGMLTLRGAGTDHVTTFFGGTAEEGDVVFLVTDEALVPGDTDGERDVYAIGPAGFSVNPICTEISGASEVCDNCLDDDEDGAIDRADSDCPPPADGAGMGLEDPKLEGKPALKCQKALGKAGAKLASQKLKRVQKCLQTAFVCIQQKPGDQACVDKATETCAKQLDGIAQDRVKAVETVTKSCAAPKLDPADLRAARGLGFEAEEPICAGFDVASLDDATAVATCLQRTHECRAEAALGVEMPRASELLRFAGRDPESELPCLGTSADGAGQALGDPKSVGKAVAKCQGALAKAGAKLIGQELKAVQKCSGLVATCMQQKSGDPECLPAATSTCTKHLDKITAPGTGAVAKHAAAIRKSCGVPAVDIAGLIASAGLGFGTHAATCAALGVSSLATVDDVVACATALHECRAAQLVETQIPRVRELLDTVGMGLP